MEVPGWDFCRNHQVGFLTDYLGKCTRSFDKEKIRDILMREQVIVCMEQTIVFVTFCFVVVVVFCGR